VRYIASQRTVSVTFKSRGHLRRRAGEKYLDQRRLDGKITRTQFVLFARIIIVNMLRKTRWANSAARIGRKKCIKNVKI
jgi:hypothetical protein